MVKVLFLKPRGFDISLYQGPQHLFERALIKLFSVKVWCLWRAALIRVAALNKLIIYGTLHFFKGLINSKFHLAPSYDLILLSLYLLNVKKKRFTFEMIVTVEKDQYFQLFLQVLYDLGRTQRTLKCL